MRKVITAIVILAIIWGAPPLRAKAGELLAPVVRMLGPVGEKMATPMRRQSAKSDIDEILRSFVRYRNEGRELPTPRTLSRWLREHPVTDRADKDPWEQPYYMIQQGRTYKIGSPGPDQVKGNEDDITDSTTL